MEFDLQQGYALQCIMYIRAYMFDYIAGFSLVGTSHVKYEYYDLLHYFIQITLFQVYINTSFNLHQLSKFFT